MPRKSLVVQEDPDKKTTTAIVAASKQDSTPKKKTLATAKKILASGITEAEAIERAKTGDGEDGLQVDL